MYNGIYSELTLSSKKLLTCREKDSNLSSKVGNCANIILLVYQEGILNERQIENGKHSMCHVTLKCEFICTVVKINTLLRNKL